MRNVIGQAVSGNDFFNRPQVISKIRRAIRNDGWVYLSAPRRVGKTSIMNFLQDNPEPGQQYIYVITQSIDSVDGFYKELSKQVIDSPAFRTMSKVTDTLKKVAGGLLQRINLKVSVPFLDISLDKGEVINFQTDFEKMLEELELDGTPFIIMVDEFTETLDNILLKHGQQEARRFLQLFRELSQNRKLTGKIQFLLTGSIGLQPLVKKLGASDLVNQLQYVDIPPLTDAEANSLFQQLIDVEAIQIDDEIVRFILQKIDWLMPFHVQLLVQEIIDVFESLGNPIDQVKAEKAFQQIFHQRNKIYFEQYYERLKKRLEPGAEFDFVHDVLNRASETTLLEKSVIHDLAVKHGIADGYKSTVESLEYDGYLHLTTDGRGFQFNSSILKTWWKKYVANPQPLIATIYNPQNQSKEALIAGFIARKQKFERIFRDVRDAPMTKPEQHYLIQGVRGMGKTTFLLRIAYEIENTPDLCERLIPIVFNEEEYGISFLSDIWERTIIYLEEADPLFMGLLDSITAQYSQPDYEQRALDHLIMSLHKHGKKLLLLIDNIGDLLKRLDEQEAKRLREVLLTVPELRLIGATSVVIEQAHDYSKPFYEFFKIIHLEGLSREEATDLFLKLGETYHADAIQRIIEQQPGCIEAIRRLMGGVIRTMVLLFEILVENNAGSVFRDLNVLLDRVTPLYKHRMDDLPAQQQKIVASLATAWDAASAKELAQVVRLESKVVSAQLKQLINNGVVEKIETNTKNHLYRLDERFFNIWYLMRFGRKTDQRVLWLVRFLKRCLKVIPNGYRSVSTGICRQWNWERWTPKLHYF